MAAPRFGQATRCSPYAGRRVVEFRTGGDGRITAPCHHHQAIREQRRGMGVTPGNQRAGVCPLPGRRIVEFRAREECVVVA